MSGLGDALTGLITGASEQYVKMDEIESKKQAAIDAEVVKRALNARDKAAEMLQKHKYKLKENEAKGAKSVADVAGAMSGLVKLSEDGSEIVSQDGVIIPPQKLAEVNAYLKVGKPGNAIASLAEYTNNPSKYKAAEVTDQGIIASSGLKDTDLKYNSTKQPIDTIKDAILDGDAATGPLSSYGRSKGNETLRILSRYSKQIGEYGRVEGTGKTTIDGDQVASALSDLANARNSIVYNPRKTDVDRANFIQALDKLNATTESIQELTGDESFNPFTDKEAFPPHVVKYMMEHPVITEQLPSIVPQGRQPSPSEALATKDNSGVTTSPTIAKAGPSAPAPAPIKPKVIMKDGVSYYDTGVKNPKTGKNIYKQLGQSSKPKEVTAPLAD